MEQLIARLREARSRTDAATVVPLEKVFRFFKRELENHLRKEEEVLFPMIAQLEAASSPASNYPGFRLARLQIPSASWKKTTMLKGASWPRCWG